MIKFMSKILISTVVFLSLNISFVNAYSVDELIELALENSPQIMQSQLDVESKKVNLYDLKKQLDKSEENDLSKIEIETLKIKYDYSKKILDLYSSQTKSLQTTKIKKSIYEYIYQTNLLEQSKADLDNQKLNFDLASSKLNQGAISKLEFDSLKNNYESAQLSYQNSIDSLDKKREELNILLGRDISLDIDISYDLDINNSNLDEFDFEDIYQFNLLNNIDYLNAKLNSILSEREYNSYIVALSEISVEARTKKISMNKSKIEYENFKDSLKSDISYELKNLMNQRKNIDIKKEALDLKTLEYDLAKKRYKNGQISLTDLNYEYNDYSKSKYEYEKLIFDFNMNLLDFVGNYNVDLM